MNNATAWNLGGRTAVITGAASGFGRELALVCRDAGMQLVLADVDEAGLAQTLALTGLAPARAVTQRCDVSRADDVDRLARLAQQRFGGAHVLFNNAGVLAAGPIWKATPQDWNWVFGVNVMGVAHGVRSFVPAMLDRGEPAWVVNVASAAGLLCPPDLGVYSASKHAVVAISECLHHELAASGKPVGVSVLCPSFVDTGIADADRQRPASLDDANPEQAATIARIRKATRGGTLSAAQVAQCTLEAVRARRFYVLPHDKVVPAVAQRLAALIAGDAPVDARASPR
ncbi:MAG: SDR family NAD(P)-dependent oxidoreductase [Burkholderiales bacterium]|nr:SDR family NAD(P)-dependent oxidoreductase [Burkholderiales bacterium]